MRTLPALALLLLALASLAAPTASPPAIAQAAGVPTCLGESRSLIISNGMPYIPVRVQGRTGFFVVDLGADVSAISPTTFLGDGMNPAPMAGSSNLFAGVDFFGAQPPLRLSVQDQSDIRGIVPQAGLIGTDLLRNHMVTLDYANAVIHRGAPEQFCGEELLRRAGFQPLSSRDYFGQNPQTLTCPVAPRPCPNIPTIPVRIGSVLALAQVDTGYADSQSPPSMNINQALFQKLQAAGVPLQAVAKPNLQLTTCVRGQSEAVKRYRLRGDTTVDLVGEAGLAVRRLSGVTLFVKNSPAAAQVCGGIGTWSQPAAQLGASFVNDGTLVVDPVGQRLWFRGAAASAWPSARPSPSRRQAGGRAPAEARRPVGSAGSAPNWWGD